MDRDDSGDPVYNLTKPNRILDAIVAKGLMAHWEFVSAPTPQETYKIHVYSHTPDIPTGDNLAEINRRAVIRVLTDSEPDHE